MTERFKGTIYHHPGAGVLINGFVPVDQIIDYVRDHSQKPEHEAEAIQKSRRIIELLLTYGGILSHSGRSFVDIYNLNPTVELIEALSSKHLIKTTGYAARRQYRLDLEALELKGDEHLYLIGQKLNEHLELRSGTQNGLGVSIVQEPEGQEWLNRVFVESLGRLVNRQRVTHELTTQPGFNPVAIARCAMLETVIVHQERKTA